MSNACRCPHMAASGERYASRVRLDPALVGGLWRCPPGRPVRLRIALGALPIDGIGDGLPPIHLRWFALDAGRSRLVRCVLCALFVHALGTSSGKAAASVL